MLRNLLDPLTEAAPAAARQPAAGHEGLRRRTSTRSPIPARERFPRDQHENFYWLQEDYIREQSAADGLGVQHLAPAADRRARTTAW